nr:transporter substrate-binding protein [Paracoccus shandongensis]
MHACLTPHIGISRPDCEPVRRFRPCHHRQIHAIQLAVEKINAAGGIDRPPLELVEYDTRSDNTRYREFMRRALQRDKVDAVIAGFSSASGEAYRPIINQFDGLPFYNNQYEGGSAMRT